MKIITILCFLFISKLSAMTLNKSSDESLLTKINKSKVIKGSSTTVTVCNMPDIAIPDNNTAGTIDVISFNQDLVITDIDVRIRTNHTWVGDLVYTLTNIGTATTSTIIDRPGIPGSASGCGGNNINTVLDDDNGTAVEDECSPTVPTIAAGPFTPNNPLSVFDGELALNNWLLNVSDHVNMDTGRLIRWCLIITGTPVVVQPDIVLSSTDLNQDVCLGSTPVSTPPITLNLASVGGYNNPIALAFNPLLESGFSGNFSVNPINPVSAPGIDSIVNIDVDNSVSLGTHTITVEATGTGITAKTLDISLNVGNILTSNPVSITPINASIGIITNTAFSWAEILGASSYDLDIATDADFTNIITSTTVITNSFTPTSGLLNNTVYYWRVRASNSCGKSNYTLAAFETLGIAANTTSTICSTPALAIPDNDSSGISDVLSITPGGTIIDIDITIDVTHTHPGDLIISIQNNAAIETIIDRPGFVDTGIGCGNENINTTIDDAAIIAVEDVCEPTDPTIGAGPFSPNNPLSIFNTSSSTGDWVINISDNEGIDTGTLNQWCVVATVAGSSPLPPADYSDLSNSYGVAKHEGGGTSKLGTSWTADSIFDEDSDLLDDDGIVASGIWLPNSVDAQISVSSTGGFISCWFDWDNDGKFNLIEKTIAQNIVSGIENIPVTIPLNSTFGSNGDDFLESRCRFYNTEPLNRVTETANGLASSGEVEDYRFSANQLTPITLAYTKALMTKGTFSLDWSTSTETGTIGYNILGMEQNTWKVLNERPIAAKGINTVLVNNYHFQINNSDIKSYIIQELTVKGTKQKYGPFASNLQYGKLPQNNLIDWKHIKKEVAQKKQLRQNKLIQSYDFIKVKVNQKGIQRISYEQLLAKGVDWHGINAQEISITFEGQTIARYVSAEIFSAGEYIEFVGEVEKSIYSETSIYELSIDTTTAKAVEKINAIDMIIDNDTYYMASSHIDADIKYSFASPAQTPWFNKSLLVFTEEKNWQFNINAPNKINNGIKTRFAYNLWGGTDWPQQEIDHHLKILFNNQEVTDILANGLALIEDNIELDADQIKINNSIDLIMPADTGVDFDLIQLNEMSITYPSKIKVIDGKLHFKPVQNKENNDHIFKNDFGPFEIKSGFKITGFEQENIRAYAYDGKKLYNFIDVKTQTTPLSTEIELPYITDNEFEYFVSESNNIITPLIELASSAKNILQGKHDYLMITHPHFKQALNQLVEYHENRGLNVTVIDVEDIYAHYSAHRVDANAIKTYIKQAQQKMDINTVLLVGGDSYDYLNNLNIDSISYIPTLYFATDKNIRYAPVDSLYTDINNDYIPDLAIGRLPVRTEQELINIINKSINFENRTYKKTATFASDRDTSFDGFSDQMIELLPSNWEINKAYINDLELNGAKASLINSLETGVTLTSYFGHSGLSSWSFENLFDRSDVQALANNNKPTLINQFGCWNTYYVMPQFNTMAHEFMQLDNKGAVAVMGASTLTESFHESELSKILIPEITKSSSTIGQAVLQAKQKLAITHPEYLDVILGWTLLGDPQIEIN